MGTYSVPREVVLFFGNFRNILESGTVNWKIMFHLTLEIKPEFLVAWKVPYIIKKINILTRNTSTFEL